MASHGEVHVPGYKPFRKEGWGVALFICLLTLAVWITAFMIHRATYKHPMDPSWRAIEPQINSVTRNIKVRAFLNKGLIAPGAFVKVVLNQQGQRIMVPSNAIIPDALSSQLVLARGNKAVFTNVETGMRNESMVEITSGVNPGDSIIVTGMLFVRPNAPIQIRKVR